MVGPLDGSMSSSTDLRDRLRDTDFFFDFRIDERETRLALSRFDEWRDLSRSGLRYAPYPVPGKLDDLF
jgi:hypothetical protein